MVAIAAARCTLYGAAAHRHVDLVSLVFLSDLSHFSTSPRRHVNLGDNLVLKSSKFQEIFEFALFKDLKLR